MPRASTAIALIASFAAASPLTALAGSGGPLGFVVLKPVGPSFAADRLPPRSPVLGHHPRSAQAARFATVPVWGPIAPSAPTAAPEPAPPRRVRPLSISPVDPNAVVARTASGRVFIAPAPGAYVATPEEMAYYRRARPYAPPSFQIVGAPADRHMSGSVRLSYGVKPPESLPMGPKVVWLDGPEADEPTADANPHVKHLK